MSLLEKLETTKLTNEDHPDVEYLKNSDLANVVNRGLAELYKIQPKNPITFLANWLLNESRSKEIKNKINESKQLKKILLSEIEEETKIIEHKMKLYQEETRKLLDKNETFKKTIQTFVDIEMNLNWVCQELKNLVNATGVYISIYDRKRKLNINDEDDETSHLLEEKVIRYINFCDDHQFLKYKFLEPGTGVTYELFTPKEDSSDKQFDDNGDQIKNEESLPNHKLVEEVVRNQSIKFFREPRLGCYLAVDITYKSALFPNALLSAINYFNEYNINIARQEERKKEYNDRLAEMLKEREKIKDQADGNQDNMGDNFNNTDNIEPFTEEKIELQEFEKEDKKIILQLDTIGQDRIFKEDELKFIFDTSKILKTSWEKLESLLLLKDRDLKIEMDELDRILKETHTVEKIETEEEKHIKEYLSSDKFSENALDDRMKMIESEYSRSRFIIKSFFEDENLNKVFLMYSQFEFVEFEKLFQNILYFVGVSNLDINEEKTNKLNWKKAKIFWDISVLKKLIDYNPFGPKSGKLSNFASIHRLIVNFENINFKREELRTYSFTLMRLLDFGMSILKVRKEDILRRKDYCQDLLEKRNLALTHKEERLSNREKEFEDAKRASVDEDGNPLEFNEDEFLKVWDENHPEIVIPEEVIFDNDDDLDFEKLI